MPNIPVQRGGRFAIRHSVHTSSQLTVEGARHVHGAEFTTLHISNSLDHVRGAAALCAGLYNTIKATGRIHHPPPLNYIVGDRLFHIHMLTRLAAPDRAQRMPVVWSSHHNGIDCFILQKFADVLHALWRTPLLKAGHLLANGAKIFRIHIT